MTAFLFIPATRNTRLARRVDFTNIAALFAEAEEPPTRKPVFKGQAMRLAAMALILVGIVGDTILVARPKLLASTIAATHQAAIQGVSPGV